MKTISLSSLQLRVCGAVDAFRSHMHELTGVNFAVDSVLVRKEVLDLFGSERGEPVQVCGVTLRLKETP